MRTVEGRVTIGGGADGKGSFASLDAFLESLRRIGAEHDATIQAFDARYVAGDAHLESAVEHARRAMDREENVADDLAVEILLYAAGRRQIDRAMEMGVAEGDQPVVVLVLGGETDAAAAAVRERIEQADVSPDPERLASFFGITDAERAASDADLETLVLERVALLDVEK